MSDEKWEMDTRQNLRGNDGLHILTDLTFGVDANLGVYLHYQTFGESLLLLLKSACESLNIVQSVAHCESAIPRYIRR